jgi:hypothetical protein
MRGKFDEMYAVRLPSDVLRFPPVSLYEKEIEIKTEYAHVKIENPLSVSAWRCLLALLRYGEVQGRDPTLGIRLSIDTYTLLAFLKTTDWTDLPATLKLLMECRYNIRYEKRRGGFVVAGHFEVESGGKTSVVFTAEFMRFLEEYASLWFYYAFAFFLRKPSAINLHAFLTANSKVSRMKLQTALERARINTGQLSKAKKYLQSALDELVEVGFLRGYSLEGDEVLFDRFSEQEIKARAIELQKRINEEIKAFIERFRRSVRESQRRRRKLRM